jgi:hypothetical protein
VLLINFLKLIRNCNIADFIELLGKNVRGWGENVRGWGENVGGWGKGL